MVDEERIKKNREQARKYYQKHRKEIIKKNIAYAKAIKSGEYLNKKEEDVLIPTNLKPDNFEEAKQIARYKKLLHGKERTGFLLTAEEIKEMMEW